MTERHDEIEAWLATTDAEIIHVTDGNPSSPLTERAGQNTKANTKDVYCNRTSFNIYGGACSVYDVNARSQDRVRRWGIPSTVQYPFDLWDPTRWWVLLDP
ncbi:hypothetical protein DFP72DRAFT_840592 [Ephemerocybe angulata]|uniref:Uncharacterized protein n=1 Tax=Ephemerocybe angulata TaxID=980116 RepID=A0A8H6IHS7_9AGAR|nr:hypothetical protein DFP72DRAFT_840592 [Tulosesus angulatus]